MEFPSLQFFLIFSTLFIFCFRNSSGQLAAADGLFQDRFNNSIKIVVDEQSGLDCTSETLEQDTDLICNSIMDVLYLLSRPPSSITVEVVINEGRYQLEGRYLVSRDVSIRGQEGHTVEIDIETQGSDPPSFIFSISFRNTEYVALHNIDFSGSHGVIGFDNVSRVEISLSSFQ